MKKIIYSILLLFIISSNINAQFAKPSDVQGMFLSLGVGPRFPIGDLGSEQAIGAGINVMTMYTDNNFAPVFFYLDVGYQNHPGDYDFYKRTNLSSLTSNIITFNIGGRYYFKPFFEDIIILMPIMEGGLSYGYIEKYHQYKIDSGKNDKLVGESKFGFHLGAGISFFLMDVITNYHYLNGNQFFSLSLRLTIPLAITI